MVEAIFYCEFDNEAGPQILYQEPNNYITAEVFESISDYIIVDKPLCGKLCTDHTILGYPMCIEDDKYHRNALFYNIGLVIRIGTSTEPYIPILRKLGSLLMTLEREQEFLSNPSSNGGSLGWMLKEIWSHLTRQGECTIKIHDELDTIHLKLYPTLPSPPQVLEYEVPVPVRDFSDLLRNHAEWDMAMLQIINYIDGIKYVKRIAMESHVDVSIVQECCRQLLYYGCIRMIDIFLHSNIYCTTSLISSTLATDTELQDQCVQYVVCAASTNTFESVMDRQAQQLSSNNSTPPPPTFQKIFALYCSITPGHRVADFCALYGSSLCSIDVRKFFTFGLIHGFLRRVHEFPVKIPSLKDPTLFTGKHHTDELCTMEIIPYTELESAIASRKHNCYLVHK